MLVTLHLHLFMRAHAQGFANKYAYGSDKRAGRRVFPPLDCNSLALHQHE